MKPGLINHRWELNLPDWRIDFHAERPHWEAGRLSDMYARLEPGDIIFDIGSEAGDFTTLFASWGLEVYWFEPVGASARTTIETLAANNLGAIGWQGFVADINRPGITELGLSTADPGFAHLNERLDLAACRLDDRPDLPIPDALTIDVEGSEFEVLKGAARLLKEHHPIVWVSIHPEFMEERYGTKEEELHALMAELGYVSKFIAFDHEHHWRFG